MPETLSVVISIFGVVGLGYFVVRAGYLTAPIGDALMDFVLKVAIPMLLFRALATAEFQGVSPWGIWTAYFLPLALIWALATIITRRLFGRDARAGVVAGVSAAYSNSVAIGIPLVQTAFGAEPVLIVIVIISVHLAVVVGASGILNQYALQSDGIIESRPSAAVLAKRIALTLLSHPLIVAALAGAAWRVIGWPLPAVVTLVMDPIAGSAPTLALFASGMMLVNYGMGRQIGPAIAISALKLLLMPALVLGAALLIGLPPLVVAVVTIVAACPTGVNAVIIANYLGTGVALASNALLISTAASVVSAVLWLTLLQALFGLG